MSSTIILESTNPSTQSSYDDRKGLGYGLLDQPFQGQKKSNSEFPYLDDDDKDLEDIEINPASIDAIGQKVHNFKRNDPGAEKSANRLYFVGAATKLHACFDNPEEVLKEIVAIAKDMNPAAGSAAVGGYSSWKAFDERPYRRTGTKKGWSESPPMSIPELMDDEEEEEFYNLRGFAETQSRSLGECFIFYEHT
jgi:hypothetical protein